MNNDELLRWSLLTGLLIWVPIVAYHRIKAHRPREPLDRRQEGMFILATLRPMALVLLVSVVVYLVNPSRMAWSALPLPPAVRWFGMVVMVAGGVLVFWTLRTLGTNLTDTVVTRKIHTLVVTGPYRWVRHPFYDAVALLLIAISLVSANWFIFATGAIVFALLVVRVSREESRLVSRFGDDYRGYMARTNRFLPTFAARRRGGPF